MLIDFHTHAFPDAIVPKAIAQDIVDKHTPDCLIFASDMPWHGPSWEKQLIETLDISQSASDKL